MASNEDDDQLKRKYMRWSGELQDAYLDALEQCGGLHEARPKALLDILQPRFPYLTLQNVKNHLQKQRTKEAKSGGGAGAVSGGRSSARAAPSTGPDDSEDLDPMVSEDAAPTAAGGGVSSRQRPESPGMAAAPAAAAAAGAGGAAPAAAAAAAPGAAGAAGTAGPAARSGPTLWLPDSWAVSTGDGSGVQPNSLIDLARRALALTVHQLGLYRKLLEELELHERDHTMLVAALREDPTGQSIVLDAHRAVSGIGGAPPVTTQSTGTAGGSASSAAGEEARPVRLRRLLARLLPPNPFSSGPKAEAALKLAAWIAAVTRDQAADGGTCLSAGSHLGGAGDMPSGFMPPGQRPTRAASAPAGMPLGMGTGASLLGSAAALSGGQVAQTTGAARPAVGVSDDEDDGPGGAGHQPHRQRRKRHKPLSELLAEIPLQEPLSADRMGMQHAVPTTSELQQILGTGPGAGTGAPPAGGAAAAAGAPQGLPDSAAGAGMGMGAGGDGLGPALSLLLQQHMQQQGGGAAGLGGAGGQQQQQQGMELDEDALMLRALDAQMSSLLLQSVSNALMRSAQGDEVPMDATATQQPVTGSFGQVPAGAGAGAGASSAFEAAAAAAAAGEIQLPAAFRSDALAAALGDEPLPTGALDISVLRSFLDMLSSGGLSPLNSTGLPSLHDVPPLGQAPGGVAPGSVAPGTAAAQAAAAAGQPLSVADTGMAGSGSGSQGSGGSQGRVVGGGAFSAFQPAGGNSGGSGAPADT